MGTTLRAERGLDYSVPSRGAETSFTVPRFPPRRLPGEKCGRPPNRSARLV